MRGFPEYCATSPVIDVTYNSAPASSIRNSPELPFLKCSFCGGRPWLTGELVREWSKLATLKFLAEIWTREWFTIFSIAEVGVWCKYGVCHVLGKHVNVRTQIHIITDCLLDRGISQLI